MENKNLNNNMEYKVSKNTARYISLMKQLIALQEMAIACIDEDQDIIDGDRCAEAFNETMGDAVKAFGILVCDKIYNNIQQGDIII